MLEVTQPGSRPPGLFSGHRPFASVPANVEKMFSCRERQLPAKNPCVAVKSLSLQIPSPAETAAPSEVGIRAGGLEQGGPSEAFNQDRSLCTLGFPGELTLNALFMRDPGELGGTHWAGADLSTTLVQP